MIREQQTRRLLVILLVLAGAAVGTAARWRCEDRGWGPGFQPFPDALEYAAGAQALVNLDAYALQIGAHRVPPRYPPGWPLLLSVAVRAGVPPDGLWRVTGALGGLLSGLLALIAATMGWWMARTGPGFAGGRVVTWSGFAAGAVVGLVWALAPLPVYLGQTLMSDEPSLLLSLSAAVLVVAACAPVACAGVNPRVKRNAAAWLVAAGVLVGVLAAVRFVGALMLAPPLVLVCTVGPPRARVGSRLRRVLWLGVGAAIAVTAVSAATSTPPWRWSGYAFWTPRWYADLGDTFGLDYALEGNPEYHRPKATEPVPHLVFALRVLAGAPDQPWFYSVGRWWPVAGWIGVIVLTVVLWRGSGPRARFGAVVALGAVAWSSLHVVVFSSYFCAYPRFYLGPLAVSLVGLAVAGARTAAEGPWSRGVVGVLGLALVAGTATVSDGIPTVFRRSPSSAQVEAAFDDWLARGDAVRRVSIVPFDPVRAQAYGLVTADVVETVDEWGRLPLHGHVLRLRLNGVLGRDEVARTSAGPNRPPARCAGS